jgi:Membrane bound beta barrel domain (DUF5777)
MQVHRTISLLFSALWLFSPILLTAQSLAQAVMKMSLRHQTDFHAGNGVTTALPKADLSIAKMKESMAWGVGLRIVNGHSTQTLKKKKLEFFIQHRFGLLNGGKDAFFGLDESNIRLGFDYGVFDNLTLGIARSSMGKIFDGYAKFSLIKQSDLSQVSAVWFSNMAISAEHPSLQLQPFYPSHRYKYTHQLMVSHVFGDNRLMLQVTPTLVHRNLVDSLSEPNDLAMLGGSMRWRLTQRLSLTGEYQFVFNHDMRQQLQPCAGAGIEIYTGGHVFQMVFTNAAALNESQYLSMDNGNLGKGEIRFGFNIVRRF